MDTKWVLGIVGSLVTAAVLWGAPHAIDARWVPKTEFVAYQSSQAQALIESDIRALQREIQAVESELKYGTLTDAQRAALEERLALLKSQLVQAQSEEL